MDADDLGIELVLVEPQRLIREAMRSFLESSGDIAVVGEASDLPELLSIADAHQPDVVLIALDGGGERDFALLRGLPSVAARARTLVLTSEADAELYARAIELGASGLVVKSQPAQLLLKAVHKVYAGELWLDRAHTANVVSRLTRMRTDEEPEAARIASLTARERQIVTLVTEGLRNKEIGERLFISEATARNHLTSILDKLELTDRFQLAVFAFRRGLVFCPQMPAILRNSAPASVMSSSRKRETGSGRPHE